MYFTNQICWCLFLPKQKEHIEAHRPASLNARMALSETGVGAHLVPRIARNLSFGEVMSQMLTVFLALSFRNNTTLHFCWLTSPCQTKMHAYIQKRPTSLQYMNTCTGAQDTVIEAKPQVLFKTIPHSIFVVQHLCSFPNLYI